MINIPVRRPEDTLLASLSLLGSTTTADALSFGIITSFGCGQWRIHRRRCRYTPNRDTEGAPPSLLPQRFMVMGSETGVEKKKDKKKTPLDEEKIVLLVL